MIKLYYNNGVDHTTENNIIKITRKTDFCDTYRQYYDNMLRLSLYLF